MVQVDVHNDIANASADIFLSALGIDNQVFSVDTVKDIFAKNSKEKDFKFNIHCNGGSVSEGLAIYDIMRTSGKNIHCHIEGGCHSMATTLLLAAPAENRSANPNARAMIHQVRVGFMGELSRQDIKEIEEDLAREENAILDIYVERTGKSKDAMRALMQAEKERTANELLQLGFISKIVDYNTNKKNNSFTKNQKTMATKTTKPVNFKTKAANLLGKIANALTEPKNFYYEDAEGTVLFSTETEEDTLAVGDTVTIADGSTSGEFVLADGRTVVVEDNVVTEITTEEDNRVAELEAQNADYRELLNEAKEIIEGFQNHGGSNYVPKGRTYVPKSGSATPSKDDIKNDANAKRRIAQGKAPKE
ncbi:hypothetical protein FACS1894156_7560 [Bacteroidia bacterium]|nr:hypothetical protein FACS1894156_7560 [Bacteroidia bacterium]